MHRRSLLSRLLGIVLAGITAIAATEAVAGNWGLGRVRDLAIEGSAHALRANAADYLQTLARERAATIGQSLNAAQQLASATRDYLDQIGASERPPAPLAFQRALDGRRYVPGTVTTTLLPPGDDDARMARLLAHSQELEMLLPGLTRQLPEIGRISYLTSFGALQTYPALSTLDIPQGWSVPQDAVYQAAAGNHERKLLWSGIHPGLGMPSSVVSAIAPVSRRDAFAGAVAVDIKLSYFNSYLKRSQVEQTGFAFLVDDRGHLVAAPEDGQVALLGRASDAREQSAVDLGTAAPALAASLDQMRRGGSAVDTVELRGRRYLIAYAPIDTLGWSLAVAAPEEEIVAGTGAISEQIAGVARDTGSVGLLASGMAVLILGAILSLVLRRQIMEPIARLASATQVIAAGDLRPIDVERDDEIGQLAGAFNTMTESLSVSRATLSEANQQLERKVVARTADLHMAVSKLEETTAAQEELLRALREVSTPVIPVIDGVLAMPLIGQIDAERAQNMISALLCRIERDRARTVLLDITGVPMIDTQVAQSLLQTVAACRLLGAGVVLVGVGPEVAQTIVALGIDLRGLRTAADLRSAVEDLLARRRI
jgi:anti-anti-sigma regulatory factor/HAMP domain-containing protein